MDGLLDTSVFISREAERPILDHPDRGGISVMTLAELHAGVLSAKDARTRAARTRTLAGAEHAFDVLPVDPAIVRRFAEITTDAKLKGARLGVADALIAATAIVHDVPLYTRDDHFDRVPGLRGVKI